MSYFEMIILIILRMARCIAKLLALVFSFTVPMYLIGSEGPTSLFERGAFGFLVDLSLVYTWSTHLYVDMSMPRNQRPRKNTLLIIMFNST